MSKYKALSLFRQYKLFDWYERPGRKEEKKWIL